jgi:hypothetical protein
VTREALELRDHRVTVAAPSEDLDAIDPWLPSRNGKSKRWTRPTRSALDVTRGSFDGKTRLEIGRRETSTKLDEISNRHSPADRMQIRPSRGQHDDCQCPFPSPHDGCAKTVVMLARKKLLHTRVEVSLELHRVG